MTPLTIYTAASFRLIHAVRLLHVALQERIPNIQILDWTDKAAPPEGLTPTERRLWFDTEQTGGQVFNFCVDACRHADIVIYLGASGQDAGIEVGLAVGAGTPVIGLRGPLEAPGLMLHGAVDLWFCAIQGLIDALEYIADCTGCMNCLECSDDPCRCAYARACPHARFSRDGAQAHRSRTTFGESHGHFA